MSEHELSKIVCEKPRRRYGTGNGKTRSKMPERMELKRLAEEALEEGLEKVFSQSVKRGNLRWVQEQQGIWRSDIKNHRDHLAPLRGWLRKQVGRKWNEVYSELKKKLPATGLLSLHVLSHVDDFVKVKVFYNESGELCYRTSWGDINVIGKYCFIRDYILYVHPETGILTYHAFQRKPEKVKPLKIIPLTDKKVEGVWEGKFRKLPKHCYEWYGQAQCWLEVKYSYSFKSGISRISNILKRENIKTLSKKEVKKLYKENPTAYRPQ